MSDLNRYEVGDVVRVVSEPVHGPGGIWVNDMDKFCGQLVTIAQTRKERIGDCKDLLYKIKEDHQQWWWREEYFEPNDISEVSREELEELINRIALCNPKGGSGL